MRGTGINRSRNLALCLLLVLPLYASAGDRFEPARAGKGRLELVRGVPVVHLVGTPEEIGEQHGKLLREQGRVLIERYVGRFFNTSNAGRVARAATLAISHRMTIPPAYQREMAALAKAAGVSYDDVLLANTMFDAKKMIQCTTVAAYGKSSSNGRLLLGRNLDFPSFGVAHLYSVVFVYHPDGGEPFVSVGFPGLVGVLSGMNTNGVAAAVMECYGHGMRPEATPYAMLYRQALERAKTVDDVVAAVREGSRSTANNLMVCDAAPRAVVIEMTPSRLAVREDSSGIITATNHFESPELRQKRNDWRLPILKEFRAKSGIDIAAMKKLLKRTALGSTNLQAMIFEPEARSLHLAIGTPPAAEKAYIKLTAEELGLKRTAPGN